MKKIEEMKKIIKEIEKIDKSDIKQMKKISLTIWSLLIDMVDNKMIEEATEELLDSIVAIRDELEYDKLNKTKTDLTEEYEDLEKNIIIFKKVITCFECAQRGW